MTELVPKLVLIAMCVGVSIVAYCAVVVGILLVRDLFRGHGRCARKDF